MPHRILYEIVSSAHKTSMCLGKKGADPPCTSYHRGCPAGRSPLAKQRLTRFDQVLNSGSKDRISFGWSGSDAELNEIPPLTADINQHYSFNTWSKALELDLYMWRRPTSFDLFQLDQLRTRTGQRVGVASLPSQMSGISELHVRPSCWLVSKLSHPWSRSTSTTGVLFWSGRKASTTRWAPLRLQLFTGVGGRLQLGTCHLWVFCEEMVLIWSIGCECMGVLLGTVTAGAACMSLEKL